MKLLLSLFVCTALWFQINAVTEMDMQNDYVANTALERRSPLLVVPKLHEDIIRPFAKGKEPLVQPKAAEKVAQVQSKSVDNIDLDFLDTPEEKNISMSLANLPIKSRPANMQDAMREVRIGGQVFNLLQQGRFYDAISLNLPVIDTSIPLQHHAQQVIIAGLNSDDASFWEMIKQDPVLAKSIAAHNVPFTLQSVQSPEFNMYFRITYIRKHIQDPVMLEMYKNAYQKSITQLQWYFFSKSILQDHAFTSGMITFHDPQSRIFSFLDGYAEFLSPKYKFYKGIAPHSLWSNQAYTRESSHWTGQKAFNGRNFGIDIKGQDGKLMSILPGNKSHLLFGVRTNGMTFLKWEEYGTTFNVKTGDYSVFRHTVRYFEKKNLEDDPTLQRREKVPKVVQDQFKALYSQPLTTPEKTLIDTNGISGMLRILELHAPDKIVKFKQFLVQGKGYQDDTLSVRKGSEIILKLPVAAKAVTKVIHVSDASDDDL